MSRMSKNYAILDTKKVRFWCPKNRFFWTFPEMSEICKNHKNLQNLKKVQKSGKSTKSRVFAKSRDFGHLKGLIRTWLESLSGRQSGHFGRSVRMARIQLRDQISGLSGIRKKCQNFRLFGPLKKSKICAGCRVVRSSQMAAEIAPWRQKNSTFSALSRGKGKKCTFFGNFERFCD